MDSGIYALYWWEQDLCYIGQAQNLSERFKEHKRKLKSIMHSNYKVQEAYRLHGEPDYVILEKCPLDQLNELEMYWTAEFDTIKTPWGLNLIEAGQVGWGANSNASKYSKYQILKVFSLLYKTSLPHASISKRVKVPKYLVDDIKKCSSHHWLKVSYPKQYSLMLDRTIYHVDLVALTGSTVSFLSPDRIEYRDIKDISKFTRDILKETEHFRKGLSKLNTGKLKTYRGWVKIA